MKERNSIRKWVIVGVCAAGLWLRPAVGHAKSLGEPNLVGKVVVVDAGHGGPDGGASSRDGIYEKDVTLKVSLFLADYLRAAGARVYLTRTTDTDLATDEDRARRRRHMGDLRERVRFIEAKGADVVVSVHCNAVPSSAWRGAQTIYMKGDEDSKRLATVLQDSFKQLLLPTTRVPDDMSTLYLLKRVQAPMALAEVGFVSNPDEAAYLVKESYQRTIAFAMYTAISQYISSEEEETPLHTATSGNLFGIFRRILHG